MNGDNGDRWRLLGMFMVAGLIGGLGGGPIWRSVDPTKFTVEDFNSHLRQIEQRIEKVQDKVEFHRLNHPDRDLEIRLTRIELLVDAVHKLDSALQHKVTDLAVQLERHMQESRTKHEAKR